MNSNPYLKISFATLYKSLPTKLSLSDLGENVHGHIQILLGDTFDSRSQTIEVPVVHVIVGIREFKALFELASFILTSFLFKSAELFLVEHTISI